MNTKMVQKVQREHPLTGRMCAILISGQKMVNRSDVRYHNFIFLNFQIFRQDWAKMAKKIEKSPFWKNSPDEKFPRDLTKTSMCFLFIWCNLDEIKVFFVFVVLITKSVYLYHGYGRKWPPITVRNVLQRRVYAATDATNRRPLRRNFDLIRFFRLKTPNTGK